MQRASAKSALAGPPSSGHEKGQHEAGLKLLSAVSKAPPGCATQFLAAGEAAGAATGAAVGAAMAAVAAAGATMAAGAATGAE